MRGWVTSVITTYKLKFEDFIQLFSGGLMFFNDKGEILEVNIEMEEIFQLSSDELLGFNGFHLLDLFNETHDNKKKFLKTLFEDGQAEMNSEIQLASGELKYINIRVAKQKNSNLYLTLLVDESEKMHLQKRLDHSESLSTLGQLAASIAHEIRNPMTSLKGFTQLLYKNTTEDGKRYLSVIDDEIKRMEEILTEFLAISKPTDYKIRYIKVEDLIIEVANFMAPQALLQRIDIKLKIEIDNECKVLGDRNLLKQVLINSIKNAIEVLPIGGNIEILVSYYDTNQVSIVIKDNGSGIEEKNLVKIFEPFFTTKSTGTGLGLSHSIKVIEDLGGRIEVETIVDKGTIFNYILPIKIEL